MREFIISTDSTNDLPETYLKENNIAVHPLYYIIDDKEYIPGVEDMPVKEFYRALKEGKMPTTSASNPINIIAKFQKEINEGHDILHLSFSSGLSSSYNNARICAEKLMEEKPGSKIIVIDTLSDLNHLFRGGRLSRASALVGTMLNIQPILHMDDEGKLAAIGKVRGRKKALHTLVDNIEIKTDVSNLKQVFISHGDCIEDAQYVAEKVKQKYGVEDIIIQDICPTIGAHTAQGAVVVAYMGNSR